MAGVQVDVFSLPVQSPSEQEERSDSQVGYEL